MSTEYVLYDTTGKIIKTGSCPEPVFLSQKEGYPADHALLRTNGKKRSSLHYVEGGEVKERAERNKSYTVDSLKAVFPSLPLGTVVRVNGYYVTSDDQPTEIEFELPGTYTVKLSGTVEYLDEKLEVTVNG